MQRVLFLAANPGGSRLQLDADSREIQQVFRLGVYRDRFELSTRTDVRWRDLRQAIVDVRPTILHFSGHGRDQRLLLVDEAGGVPHEVPLTALRELLGGLFGVRLLVLSACDTADASAMFRDVVDHVIAMRGAISDEGAALFAQGFYSALANGHPIDACFRAGRAEIAARGGDPGDVDRPVLVSRPGASMEVCESGATAIDPLVAVLRRITTQRNVYPLLPLKLAAHLGDAFPVIEDVIDIISQADALIQQAGDALPEPYRGYRLTVAHVPLQAGARRAWISAVRDAAALTPFALMAILLIARERKPGIPSLPEAIETISNLRD